MVVKAGRSGYNLSDPQIEREIRDRISFMNFLGYPDKLPDRNTIWYFRERLSKTGNWTAADSCILIMRS